MTLPLVLVEADLDLTCLLLSSIPPETEKIKIYYYRSSIRKSVFIMMPLTICLNQMKGQRPPVTQPGILVI